MAQFELPTKLWINRRAFPYWIDQALDSNVSRSTNYTEMISVSTKGIAIVQPIHNTWCYVPVIKQVTVDNFEILMRVYRSNVGTSAWINGGLGLLFRQADAGPNENYCYVCLGSGSIHKNISIRSYDTLGTSSDIYNSSVSGVGSQNSYFNWRVRREGTKIKVRAWVDGTAEPTGWQVDVTDELNKYSNVSIRAPFDSTALDIITDFAYATDGDTAQFNLPAVTKTVAHQRSGATTNDYSIIKDRHTHDVLSIIPFNNSGTWVKEIPEDWDFYIVDEILRDTFLDFRFANGDGYLGGDYPDGIVTIAGVPVEADIDVRLRMPEDPVLDGKIIRQGRSSSAGTWHIPNLAQNLKYDVIARHDGEKDMLAPDVTATVDTNLQPYYTGGWGLTQLLDTFSLRCVAERMVPPLSVEVTGMRIPTDIESEIQLDQQTIQIVRSLRDHGRFEFEINVQDSMAQQMSIPVLLENVKRTSFVTVVGTVVSVVTTNVSSKAITLPSSVLPGDLIIIAVMHRHNSLTVVDNSGQVWERVSSWSPYYAQGSTILYRKAVEGDASREVTMKLTTSAFLTVHCLILRGKFLPLEVRRSISHSARYDETYSTNVKNLTPVEHDSGFMVRSVSNVYALSEVAKAKMILSGMTMVGAATGAPYRMQTGYTHLAEPGVFNGTYQTDAGNTEDSIPDVVLIIDEVRE